MLERRLLVRVAPEAPRESWVVEDERDAEEAGACRDGRFDRERELPHGLARGLDEGARRRGTSHRSCVAGGEQRARATVDDGLGRRDDEHEVGVDDGRIDADLAGERGEVGRGRVVHHDPSTKRSSLGRGQEAFELVPSGPAGEPARDEQGDAIVRYPEPVELVEDGRERGLPRIRLRAWHGERRRLDDDGHARVARDQPLERQALEWKRQRVANRRRDVDDA